MYHKHVRHAQQRFDLFKILHPMNALIVTQGVSSSEREKGRKSEYIAENTSRVTESFFKGRIVNTIG